MNSPRQKNINMDFERRGINPSLFTKLRYFILDKSLRCIILYRCRHYNNNRLLRLIYNRLNSLLCPIEISPNAEIGGGLMIAHPQCIVIGAGVTLGENALIYQGVTIGAKTTTFNKPELNISLDRPRYPTIGDNVIIYAGAVVIGPISIGDNVIIGANSVVMTDVGSNTLMVGVPGRPVNKNKFQ